MGFFQVTDYVTLDDAYIPDLEFFFGPWYEINAVKTAFSIVRLTEIKSFSIGAGE